jgi:gliding-associated putative ABC transporter substrate-binding component GldG
MNKIGKILKNQGNLGAGALLVIGILAVVNFFSYQIFYRLDLTANKEFSLSPVSKETVKNIDDIIKIKAYFSSNLPSQYVNLPQEVKDILDEYQTYSGGKLKVEFIDPKDDQALQGELQIKGIPQLQFNVMEKDKYQVVNGYLGMSIQYGDKTETIPVIQDTGNLEYQITSKIKKITAKELPVIGVLTGNGALDTTSEISAAFKDLSLLYDVVTVPLSTDKKIDDKVKTLIVPGPKEEFSKEELKAIDDFLMRGGSALFLLDGVKVDNSLQASYNETGLDKLLESYGLRANKDLVLDESAGVASFNQGFVTFNINYPFWPKIIKSGFDADSATVSRLEAVIFPWVSSVDLIKDKLDASDKIVYLVKSSDKSWLMKDSLNLNPQQDFTSSKKDRYDLAISLTGRLKSAYNSSVAENARIVLVGDSDFLRDNFVRGQGDNMTFFQNLVDGLALDEALVSIRAKGSTDRPINKELSDKSKAALRYFNVFGLTVLIIALGMWRYYSRRKSRMVDEL